MVIKAKVNGVEGRFLLDNGASISCFNKDFAKRSNLSFRRKILTTDGNNNRTYLRKANVKKIQIGDALFSKTQSLLIDTKKFLPCNPVEDRYKYY